jgi:cytoskeleton protein RodZ
MSDETDKQDAEAGEQEARGPRAGERLAEARKEKQITVVEIAKELHLDEPKVRALERNEFEMLGAPVFAKGHMRKYAELVDVDPGDVLTEYYEMNRGGPTPLVVTSRSKPRKELTPGPWIAIIVVAVAIGAAYWWFAVRTPAVRTATEQAMPLPVEESAEPVEEPAVEQADEQPEPQPQLDPDPEPQAETVAEPVVEQARPSQPEPAPVAEPDDGELRLAVTFSGDCWTEITDAGGRRLYFGLGKAGRTVNVSGEAPLNVLFGDAANVSLVVNGADRPIAPAERRGKTARFTIVQP